MADRIKTLFGEEIIPEELETSRSAGSKEENSQASVLEGWIPQKMYYSTGAVAKLFALRASTIRYWSEEFEMRPRTTRNGDRLFSVADIEHLRSIYHLLRERKFTIAGAKAHLAQKPDIPETLTLRKSLLSLRNQLLEIRNKLS
ncbi:MAG: MerR family transcriptional regulator [Bacteroidetes bacterium]|nr:MerR family transcriptional regulator [Bacteroidota bacterium]MBS1629727.1 MerR family transcriptional regulator [Bacteroidota bacterium]